MRWWWRGCLLYVLVGWALVMAVRCHLPRQASTPPSDSTSAIYVVQHGWHAGIAVRRADLPEGAWPVLDAFPDAEYLEVGWGEARYYPGHTREVWGAVQAGGWPTASVLHVVPVSQAIPKRFPHHTIVRLPVGPEEMNALAAYVAASFAADDGAAEPVAPGFYADSRFFRSELPYHVFNNCNHWAAGALEAAGCDTAPRRTMTIGQVLAQARDCGTIIQQQADE